MTAAVALAAALPEGAALDAMTALALAWCELRPGEEPPEPWGELWAPLGELPRQAVALNPEPARALALAALGLDWHDYPRRGTPSQRWETVLGAALAVACGLPPTPGNIRDMRDPDKLVDAVLRVIGREMMRRERAGE